jgi:imidazolonepropionase-like amidohydrolase
MARTIFRSANLLDGDHAARPGTSVVIEGERIREIGPDASVTAAPDDRVIELRGRTLMPGLWSCHFHTCFSDWAPGGSLLGLEAQPAFMTILAERNVTLALDCGFTSLVCSSSVNNIDHALKVAIVREIIPGPRLWACTHEMMSPGDQADGQNYAWYMEVGNEGLIRRCSGPGEFRKAILEELGRGADIAKVAASGGHGVGPAEEIESLSRVELQAAVEAAHGRGKRIRAHAASRRSILECARAGVDIIDHADRLDREGIDAILDADVALAPSMLFAQRFLPVMQAMLDDGLLAGPSHHAESQSERQERIDGARVDFENISRMLPEANDAGLRIVLGDDFGVAVLPHGDYADELTFYVKEIGIPPLDVLRWATKHGAETVGRADDLGTLEVGKIADLLVVDGDPIADIGCLKDRDNLHAIVQSGLFYKDALG